MGPSLIHEFLKDMVLNIRAKDLDKGFRSFEISLQIGIPGDQKRNLTFYRGSSNEFAHVIFNKWPSVTLSDRKGQVMKNKDVTSRFATKIS